LREVLWRGIDQLAIDGTVKRAVDRLLDLGDAVRRMQSGSIHSYAAWILLGAVVAMVFMVLLAS
jgi:NADH-quinone oxidoreductase subunit L